MSAGMNVKDRITDISKRCGMSEDIIRRVLTAERESCIESLKRGENATLIGRAILKPYLRNKVEAGVGVKQCIMIRTDAAPSLKKELEELREFSTDGEDIDDEGVLTHQIMSLE